MLRMGPTLSHKGRGKNVRIQALLPLWEKEGPAAPKAAWEDEGSRGA